MSPRSSRLFVVLALALAPSPATAGFVVFESSGLNAAAITPTVTNFRNALGNPDNLNAAGPLASGRREINWDGGGAVTNAPVGTPFTGFLNTRGALFTTPGTGFVQAPTSGPENLDTFFGRTDGLYNATFDPFSAQRVFTPVGSNITDATFFIPGTNGAIPAVVSAFGAIFSDVDTANVTSLEFFDLGGTSLGTFFVLSAVGDNTFSFLGVQFNAGEQVGRVRITTGNQILSATNIAQDQVVMDDFIFSEPATPVPAPSSLALVLSGAVGLAGLRLRKKQAALALPEA